MKLCFLFTCVRGDNIGVLVLVAFRNNKWVSFVSFFFFFTKRNGFLDFLKALTRTSHTPQVKTGARSSLQKSG